MCANLQLEDLCRTSLWFLFSFSTWGLADMLLGALQIFISFKRKKESGCYLRNTGVTVLGIPVMERAL